MTELMQQHHQWSSLTTPALLGGLSQHNPSTAQHLCRVICFAVTAVAVLSLSGAAFPHSSPRPAVLCTHGFKQFWYHSNQCCFFHSSLSSWGRLAHCKAPLHPPTVTASDSVLNRAFGLQTAIKKDLLRTEPHASATGPSCRLLRSSFFLYCFQESALPQHLAQP